MARCNLPVEVVAQILRFLSVSDRKEAALVNHVWYEASLDPVLLRDTVITFPAHAMSADIIGSLAKRRAPNLVLENIDGSFQSKILLHTSSDYISNHLISLSLKGSDISESSFIEIISKCSSLETLDLSCCNSLFMSGMLLHKREEVAIIRKTLSGVRELNLSSIRHISDVVFNRIISTCQNLEKLHLSGNQIIFHTAEQCSGIRFANKGGNTVTLTFVNILTTLKERAGKIKCLSFNRTSINDNSLETLAKVSGLIVEELYLVNCREISEDGMVRFCKYQTGLRVLDVSQCMMYGDTMLSAVCATQTILRKLSTSKQRISDGSVNKLHKLAQLKELDLSSCHTITYKGLVDGLTKGTTPKLTHLNLNCCSSIKDPLILGLSGYLPNLIHLDLGSTGITDWGLVLVSLSMSQLRYLRLAWCRNITDNGLLGLVQDDQLSEHDVSNCPCTRLQDSNIFRKPDKYREPTRHAVHFKEQVLSATNGERIPLSNLHHLQELDMTACGKVTDEGLVAVLPGLRQLRILRLSMCTLLTDQTLYTIAQHNVIAEEIDISNGVNYTDRAMSVLAQGLRRLTHLNLSNCDNLSDATIDSLRRHSRRLKHLDVSLNAQITVPAVEKLEHSLKHLQQLHKRLIGNADDAASAYW